MNLRKIALEAGVSVSTVSKAFNNAADISDATREKIFLIAKQHGCFGKYIKNKFDKKVIAVVCPEINSELYASIMETLKISVEANDAIMVISEYNFDEKVFREQVEYFSGYLNVDGIITFTASGISYDNIDTPLTVIGKVSEPGFGCVSIDLYTAIKKAIIHLSELNHKHIAFIGDSLTESKRRMFSEIMNELRIPLMSDNVIMINSRFEDAGRRGAEIFVKTGCTAAVCAYDNIAFGVIDRLNELGYRVPDDYSVIGMDNIRASEYSRESLTTISFPVKETCEKAVEILMNKINNKHSMEDTEVLFSELIIRGSTSMNKNY